MSSSLHTNDNSRDILITIGGVVALVFIAVVLLFFLDPNKNAAAVELRKTQATVMGEIEMLETETRAYQARVSQMEGNITDLKALEAIEKEISLTQETEIVSKLAIFEERENISSMQTTIENHMVKYRDIQRQKARGRQLDEMTTKKSNTYKNVKILSVDDIGIQFSHKGGVSRVSFQDLGRDIQEEFGYNENLAMLAKKREKQIEKYFAQQAQQRKEVLKVDPTNTKVKSKDELFDDYLSKLSIMRLLEKQAINAAQEAEKNPTKAVSLYSIETWAKHSHKLRNQLKSMQRSLASIEAQLIKDHKGAAIFIRKEKRRAALRSR